MKTKVLKSKALRSALFDDTLDGLAYCRMIFDRRKRAIDFIYLDVNKNFGKLTGLRDVIGKRATEIMPGVSTSNPELIQIYGKVSLTGKPKRFEAYIEALSKWFFISAYSTKKRFFVMVFQDITASKQIEKDLKDAKIAARNVLEDLWAEKEALAREKAKDMAMLASIGDGVIIVDLDGKITFVNKSAQDLFGYRNTEIIGKSIFDVVSLEDEMGEPVSLGSRPVSRALASHNNTTTHAVYYYIRKDKTRFPAAITVAPVKLDNKLIGAIEVFRDITREQEIDKAKSEFVSLASHQLRTPLTAVSWYTEMILRGDVGKIGRNQMKYLNKIHQGNRRMVELVDTLLDVSRIELGTLKGEEKSTDIVALAQSVLDEQRSKIKKKKLKIAKSFNKDVPMFIVDPRFLHIVFQNLLNNAVEYTPLHGRIEFSVSLDSHKNVLIKVSDTGYGIPKHQHDQIFTKLFRADNVKDKKTDGTGLGLYIVKSIVENAHGKIWFESEENKGTTFYATLPLKMG